MTQRDLLQKEKRGDIILKIARVTNNTLKNKIHKKDKYIIKKTLIFIDNIERLGYDSKNILRIIYKLRKIPNLFFILVTDLNKLNMVNREEYLIAKENEDKNEYPIYKFINLGPFRFIQSYTSMIRKLNNNLQEERRVNFREEEMNLINNALNKTQSEQYSIRKLER